MPLNIFNIFGYLSVLLWVSMLVLWALHFLRRPRGWLCHCALALGLLALLFATINSKTYVNRIRIDYSEQIAEAQARQQAARQAAEKARSEEVAQIRFAEDDSDDYLDLGGLEEADRKYLESFDESALPEWKKEKRVRRASRARDDSVEGLLNTQEQQSGADVSALEGDAAESEPVTMSQANVVLANRLDGLNLKLIRWLLLIGVILLVVDYLRRLNSYTEAYLPLPLPSSLVNGMTPLPSVQRRPSTPRRPMPEELAWLIRRGDAFVYMTDQEERAAGLPDTLHRLPLKRRPVDILNPAATAPAVDDSFVFEALWYNRASFVVTSRERAVAMLEHFTDMLRRRRETRARVRQTVHVVWDCGTAVPAPLREDLLALAAAAGWSILLNNPDGAEPNPSTPESMNLEETEATA